MKNSVLDSDIQLVKDLKAGSQYALRQLESRYGERVYSLALSRLNDRYNAETVYQDTLLQVVRKIDDFEFRTSEEDFKRWLFRIAVNKTKDAVRKHKRDQRSVILLSLDDEATNSKGESYHPIQKEVDAQVYSKYTSCQFEVNDTEDLRHKVVNGFIDKLSTRDRAILECRANDISDREIAQIVGIPARHVKVYFSRIKHRMTKFIQGCGHSNG